MQCKCAHHAYAYSYSIFTMLILRCRLRSKRKSCNSIDYTGMGPVRLRCRGDHYHTVVKREMLATLRSENAMIKVQMLKLQREKQQCEEAAAVQVEAATRRADAKGRAAAADTKRIEEWVMRDNKQQQLALKRKRSENVELKEKVTEMKVKNAEMKAKNAKLERENTVKVRSLQSQPQRVVWKADVSEKAVTQDMNRKHEWAMETNEICVRLGSERQSTVRS